MINNEGVANSQDVANKPAGVTTTQELTNSHISQEYSGNQMDNRSHVSPSGHAPTSHAGHMITPPKHNYTLYDSQYYHKDASLYLNR